ncbi:MAG: signal peptidase I [Chloroflexi bacterium]|nr:signal peptidase I [Chloroflexota bacterium]|tara:strand:- start:503 stop:967 length:465 start_codon:yes stop_codon:yes gene_type:complete
MINLRSLIIPFVKNLLNILFFPKNYMIFKITEMNSNSMEPNFHEGSYYLVKKISDFSSIKRFDVIIYFCKIHSLNHIKRVVGLPNETLNVYDNSIFVNTKKIDNISIPDSINIECKIRSIEYFLLSDNIFLLGKSCDSIKNGPIKKENIIGSII